MKTSLDPGRNAHTNPKRALLRLSFLRAFLQAGHALLCLGSKESQRKEEKKILRIANNERRLQLSLIFVAAAADHKMLLLLHGPAPGQ